MNTRRGMLIVLLLAGAACGEPLTLPQEQRPEWLDRDGIVMAGSWEPLLFRVRRDGAEGYTPTEEQLADYRREHSPEMVDRLQAMGVNFVMMHCYKGAGMKAERESMEDAVRFARLCHERGLRVGVYVCSGAFLWELFFQEAPEAREWVLHDENGAPVTYGGGAKYRYYWNRNHPGAEAYYRRIVRFAVEQIQADLIHFDNYVLGPGYDANSTARFREHLRAGFTPRRLEQMGIENPLSAAIPKAGEQGLLRYAWDDFRTQSLADSYAAMSRFCRSMRPDVLVECNPGGVSSRIVPPIDHGRLLQGGEAFWDEGRAPGFASGRLTSRIRTYKVARAMDNMAFCYTTTPLEMAESMAFNSNCLGAVCWFEYAAITRRPASAEPVSPELAPFVRFFHNRRDLLRNAGVVADVAVLRSFPSAVFGDARNAALTSAVEEALIGGRAAFQILHDHQLDRLKKYRVLVLAGCPALSDEQVERIKAFVREGGRLCLVGPAATHNQWMEPRAAAFDELPESRVTRCGENDDVLAAVRMACDGALSLSVEAEPGLCAELAEQPGRRLVHLVNYCSNQPAKNVAVRLRLPDGKKPAKVTLVSPGRDGGVDVPFAWLDGAVSFTVPEVDVYEIAVIAAE